METTQPTNRGRSDVHSPSNLVPSDYTYEGSFDARSPAFYITTAVTPDGVPYLVHGDENEKGRLTRLLAERAGGPYSGQGETNRCDHCGAWVRYHVVWEHRPTGTLIVTGEQCAERMELTLDQLAHKRSIEAAVRALNTQRNHEYRVGFAADEPDIARALLDPEHPVRTDGRYWAHEMANSIAEQFAGSKPELSERQVEAMRKAVDGYAEHAERVAEWKAQAEAAGPAPRGDKRQRVEGEITKTKTIENDYGTRFVMTVKLDNGSHVWGSIPDALRFTGQDDEGWFTVGPERGDRVAFDAKFEPVPWNVDNPDSWAKFNRPTKAAYLAPTAKVELQEKAKS